MKTVAKAVALPSDVKRVLRDVTLSLPSNTPSIVNCTKRRKHLSVSKWYGEKVPAKTGKKRAGIRARILAYIGSGRTENEC